MGRKRNQGKARKAAKAAKAKAKEEAEESRGSNSLTTTNEYGAAAVSSYILEPGSEGEKCLHSLDVISPPDVEHPSGSFRFLHVFRDEFEDAIERTPEVTSSLVEARSATSVQFAEVWKDSTKMKMAISFFLGMGTQVLLGGNYVAARQIATFARYFEQYIAVVLAQTQALVNWPKIVESYFSDEHTLVKFFRHRIPCRSCLDEKYEEVKHVTKLGCCWNPQCSREVERSNTKYCSRCRSVVYCSRECQVAHWTTHKPECDIDCAIIARFEAKQHNSTKASE